MASVHRTLAFIVVLLALGGALWAAQNWLRRGSVSPRLLTMTLATSAVIGLQALLGIVLAVSGNRPVDGATHFVVGPLTLFVLPVARRVVGDGADRRSAGILAGAWLLLLLLALRAVGSGGGLN